MFQITQSSLTDSEADIKLMLICEQWKQSGRQQILLKVEQNILTELW